VFVVIEFVFIGVLKVAVINLTALTLADGVTLFFLKDEAPFLTAALCADTLAAFAPLKATFVPPLAGDVRITVGVTQTFTIPWFSF
jgi:hypothetical protein